MLQNNIFFKNIDWNLILKYINKIHKLKNNNNEEIKNKLKKKIHTRIHTF